MSLVNRVKENSNLHRTSHLDRPIPYNGEFIVVEEAEIGIGILENKEDQWLDTERRIIAYVAGRGDFNNVTRPQESLIFSTEGKILQDGKYITSGWRKEPTATIIYYNKRERKFPFR